MDGGSGIRKSKSWFANGSLLKQFAFTGGFFMLVAMAMAGVLISNVVSKVTIENTASSTALFLNSLVSPVVQDLAKDDALPADKVNQLDSLLGEEAFSSRFPHLEIWRADGLVVYSKSADLIGRKFAPPEGVLAALAGDVSARYADLSAAEHAIRDFSKTYLEIYVPIREHLSGRIIAVAEIHEVLGLLEQELGSVQRQTWLAIIGSTALIMLGLFGIVYRGNKVIEAQKADLRERLDQIEDVSRQNRQLGQKVQQASSRVTELNERFLRSIGADLHDGPAQLISFAALKVDQVRRAAKAAIRTAELQMTASALADALDDIRSISRGLMLPEIENLQLQDVIRRVALIHERRTNTSVRVDCPVIAQPFSHAIKICVYRFVQEGLNNAFRHAGGEGQQVKCNFENSQLVVVVEDNGCSDPDMQASSEAGMGLAGLRDRVESLGGTFSIHREPGAKTRIEMSVFIMGTGYDG